ncbi:glucose-6-phosphate isomerase [Fontimonas thermophila]|uniref:Glucose-6-phosphate isomerase n=1 Tax=Fontimonas thermophila TaxID=1076937 RepID=A0A1I2HQD6_9GAMM|nr:glucose-6-phosphate isomerase [Fontimonas thermophila]SFF30601.1 glucose-6-phosphate isomerase [Fontimonas thermophila]
MSPTSTPAWQDLRRHAARLAEVHLSALFARDPARAQRFAAEACGLYLDYSKQRIDAGALGTLLHLAEQQDLAGWRRRLFAGEPVNHTEQRAALHMALRAPRGVSFVANGCEVSAAVHAVRDRMYAFAAAVRSGERRGARGARFEAVVNIGIGGSDFGPRMVCAALAPQIDGPRPWFVANVDGAELHDTLARLRPETTLFIVTSKTFSTQETLANAQRAREWLVAALGEAAVSKHFVAVSTHAARVAAFGIDPAHMFEFWDWVGGRYSVWSAVGLSIVLALGPERFDALLAGAHALDRHFVEAPAERNLPVLMGLLGIWNTHFLGCASQVVVPYAQRLELFCGWLQQLELESNGKGVNRAGLPVDHATTPVLWGSVGTNAQHAYFQMLHQGPAVHAVDFILPVEAGHPYPEMQRMLVANCLAQSAALMRGKTATEVRAELAAQGLAGEALDAAVPHRVFPGNRPSNTLLLPRLDAYHLGALLALYEHRTFVQSVIWDINPFDQWGVELGKQLAQQILDPARIEMMDASTKTLYQRIGAMNH